MKDKYLEILGLSPGATEKEVKAAYRKLSKRYHPDVNKDENAKERFTEITEAYKFLIKVAPDLHSEETVYEYNTYVSEYEQLKQKVRAEAKRKAREKAQLQEELIKKILHRFNLGVVVVILFNLLLSIDYLLPVKEYEQKILGMSQIYESSRSGTRYRYDELYFEDFIMRFDKGEVIPLIRYDKAVVLATLIFRKPKSAMITVDGKAQKYDQILSVYKVFGYIIPIIFVLFFSYLYIMQSLDHKLTLAIFMVFLFVVQVFLFFRF